LRHRAMFRAKGKTRTCQPDMRGSVADSRGVRAQGEPQQQLLQQWGPQQRVLGMHSGLVVRVSYPFRCAKLTRITRLGKAVPTTSPATHNLDRVAAEAMSVVRVSNPFRCAKLTRTTRLGKGATLPSTTAHRPNRAADEARSPDADSVKGNEPAGVRTHRWLHQLLLVCSWQRQPI
jgi:hypothetical protein